MSPPFKVTGTFHYGLEGWNIPTGASWNYNNNIDLNYTPAQYVGDGYHSYGLEWNTTNNHHILTWFYDGNPYFQVDMQKQGSKYNTVMRDFSGSGDAQLTCKPYTNRCPSKYGVTLSQAAFESFINGFNTGYYLIINMAVGGNGVSPSPDPKNFPYTEMKIANVKRYIIE